MTGYISDKQDFKDFVVLVYEDTCQSGPCANPIPPVPEAVTIILMSLGLVTLGGFIWYRRRKLATIAT